MRFAVYRRVTCKILLADLECTGGAWSVGQGDIRNAFYLCRTPGWLQEYFCLPSILAGDLGADVCRAAGLSTKAVVFPQVCVLPMGWT